MSDDDLTAGAIELAERILEEVTSIEQDWATISACARKLSELADTAAGVPPRPMPPPAGAEPI